MQGSPTTHQESAQGLISYIPHTPVTASSDRPMSDKHASSMPGVPIPASQIDLPCGSTHADLRCHPYPAPADPDESPVEIHMTPPSTSVSVIWRSNAIVLIRLPRNFRKDQAQALDYRQSCDSTEDAHQIPIVDDNSTLRRLRSRRPRRQPSLHRSHKDVPRYAYSIHPFPLAYASLTLGACRGQMRLDKVVEQVAVDIVRLIISKSLRFELPQ